MNVDCIGKLKPIESWKLKCNSIIAQWCNLKYSEQAWNNLYNLASVFRFQAAGFIVFKNYLVLV